MIATWGWPDAVSVVGVAWAVAFVVWAVTRHGFEITGEFADPPEPESAAPRGGAIKAEPDKPEQDAGGVTDER